MVSYLLVGFRPGPAAPGRAEFPVSRSRYSMKRIVLQLLTILVPLACLAPPAGLAADPAHLYSGESVVADQGGVERARALPLALEQVLRKLSGLPHFEDRPLVGPSLDRAASILLSYHYRNAALLQADGGVVTELRLVARFAQPEVDGLARALHLPVWQPERAAVVVWLIIDEGDDRRIMPEEFAYARESMTDAAAARGLPVEWPEPGPEGEYGVDPQLLWGGYTEDLAAPDGKGVMIVAARREGSEWGVRINLGYRGQHWAWRLQDIDLQAALQSAMQQAVDQIAAANTIAAADLGSWEQELTVAGLRGAAGYQRCLAYLQRLSVVDGVTVVAARPGVATFRLALRAVPRYLEEAFAADGVLAWVESERRFVLVEAAGDDG